MEFQLYQFYVNGQFCADSKMSDSDRIYIALLELSGFVQKTAVTTPTRSEATVEVYGVINKNNKQLIKQFPVRTTILTPFEAYQASLRKEFNACAW